MTTVLTLLVGWIGFSVLLLIIAVIYEIAERHAGHDPLDAIFNEERVQHRATVTTLYPARDRTVQGVTKKPPATLTRPRGDH